MKFKIQLYLVLSFFISWTNKSLSQSYSFKTYSIAEGLAQTQVTSIVEDNKGYLWVGTLGGLSRFNGIKFKNFSVDNGLLSNRITTLYKDSSDIWIGHESGISLYRKTKFYSWKIDIDNVSITNIFKFNGRLIISTFGEGLFQLHNNKLIPLKLKNEELKVVRKLEVVGDKLFLASRTGVFYTTDLKQFTKVQTNLDWNISEIKKQGSSLIIATVDGIMYHYDIKSKKINLLHEFEDITFTKEVLVDQQTVYAVNSLGLSILGDEKKELINSNKGLPSNSLNCILKDRNGTFWIGSNGKGLFRFVGTNIVYYNTKNGLQSDLITSVSQDKNKMIFGTYDQGIINFENNQFSASALPNNMVWTTSSDVNNNWWVGTQNGLFQLTENKTIKSFARDTKISCLYRENEHLIWVGSSNGLQKIRKGVFKEDTNSFFNYGTIRAIVRFQNKLLCGTDKGLYFYTKAGKYELFQNFSKRINSLKIDEQNLLWIGTEEGLFYFDGKKIIAKKLGDEPASKFINFLDLRNQKLFIGTNNGLYILAIANDKIYHYGIDEGIINLETNINSCFFDRLGNFWFGTAEGLIKMNALAQIHQKEAIPFLHVVGIKVNYELLHDKKLVESRQKNPNHLVLPYNKNNLIFELDGVLLKKYSSLSYEYWLEGLDPTWSPPFTNTNLSLSNLPSGDYTLHIRAKNAAGKYSKEYQLLIIIKPVFYKSWWFIGVVILLFIGLIFGIFKFRINREKRERYKETLEFKAKLLTLEQQTLNASMNRHFIFNSLNSIQYFINTQDKLSANKFLSNFAKLIRKNLDSSAEDGGLVTLQEEIERLELYLSLEAMRFKDRFTFKIEMDPAIDIETIKIPAMLLQPFVENSIIHGILPLTEKKGEIVVKITQNQNEIEICIDDNGIGIDNSMGLKGLKSGDHKSKGTEITLKRIEILNKFNEQMYQIIGPKQITSSNRLINGTRVLIKIMLKNLVTPE